ncbi:hypothetical protein QBC46DRAFT_275909 [Diplogelasinospora grovesii]|uniref:Uncharacterized protein n=1 Tax=Diplogelasinospora grovesii TaxID=303347 RepID=A0AAN6NJB5_9PEZI|nr:hypothetical protein QBC46DRAFT_275909 [Diplogelasinospora grovesii]
MVVSVILAMLSLVIISSFLTQRFLLVRNWRALPFVQWLVFAIYTDSFLFVFAAGILQYGIGIDHSMSLCEAAILLCLACYVTTKLIYLFLVEKAHMIRPRGRGPRLRSKLYIFNSFGMIGIYCIVVILNFIFRITRMENGLCIIGMKRPAMIPLIGFDLCVNIYLTIIFLMPLTHLYSYKNQQTLGNRRLKVMAKKTFIGCICTLASSIVNLSVLMALDGEPGWVCLMCCNSDILFSAIVIQWVTSKDNTLSAATSSRPVSRSRSSQFRQELGGLGSRKGRRTSTGGTAETEESARGRHDGADSSFSSTLPLNKKADVELAADGSPHEPHASTCEDCQHEEGLTNDELGLPLMTPAYFTPRHGTSNVHVHVDYGSTLSHDPGENGGAPMGNSVTIRADGANSQNRKNSPGYRHSDGGL